MDSVLYNAAANDDCGGEVPFSKSALETNEDSTMIVLVDLSEEGVMHTKYHKTILPPFPTAFRNYLSVTSRSQREFYSKSNVHSNFAGSHPRSDQSSLLRSKSCPLDVAACMSSGTWTRLEEMGRSRSVCGRYLEALHFYEQALREKVRNLGEHHRDLIPTLLYTSRVLGSLNRKHEACQSLENAVRLQRYNIRSSHDNNMNSKPAVADNIYLANLEVELGEMQQNTGNLVAAMISFRDALNM